VGTTGGAAGPLGWQPVTEAPECIGFGLMPLGDDDGALRPVMLVVWTLDEHGGALVQPAVRGQDDPLPWGLRTNVRATDGTTPLADAIGGYADAVLPMVLAVEAMLARGMSPDEVAASHDEALELTRTARDTMRGLRRPAGGAGPDS
jgi:hypothetical protein